MEEIHVSIVDNPSIEHVLRPVSYISWFLGVGIARPRECSKAVTIIIRIVHLVMCAVNMVYNVIDLFNYIGLSSLYSHVFLFIHVLDRVMCYVSAYYYLYHGIGQYDKWPKLMDKIKELDQEIKRETHINDQSIKNMIAASVLTTFACCPLLLIAHVLYYYFIYPEYLFISDLILYYMIAKSVINSFVFDIVVYVLYCRYQAINELLDHLDGQSEPQWIALKIRRIRKLHNDICDLIIMVNDIHGLYLLFYSVHSFTTVVTTLFTIYITVVQKDYGFILLNNIFWILYIIQFGLMCWICTLVRQESDKTGIIISTIVLKCKPLSLDKLNERRYQSSLEMQPSLKDPDNEQNFNWSSGHDLNNFEENFLRKNMDCVRNEFDGFSVQLQHRRVAFTACDFFEMSNGLFCGFIGVIITYLIICIQFSE
ncbi:uncharacterized protein LOC105837882 isoform X2 [Monomorium pharaonis]|uniref:uncharacterized protein LOC105837882 isoform X2 n=1 Tax=Monomorium pharaonis TaxID=307658 RepID=UPI00063F5322|nr:uncharacterized protein LOC105837882 isoform X2 [Monomorium pharaonis]